MPPDNPRSPEAPPPPPPPLPPVAPASAAAIEEANIANILAKLSAGKVLTRAEERRAREYADRLGRATPAAATAPADETAKVADNMEAAVALSGLSRDELARAKSAGCPAFRGSRIYIAELLEWYDENRDTLPTGNSELDAITLEIAREKLRKAKLANDVEHGLYIRREEEAQRLLALGLNLKATLRRRMEDDAPDRLAHRSREEILPVLRAIVDELCREFQEGVEQWR